MSPRQRRTRVSALAKVNLDLRVLDKRPDGFHELRTVFQTVSLDDTIDIAYTPARATSISVAGMDIPDNLVERAARLALDEMGLTADIAFEIKKRIPMGAGLGGGSSDAAAVLLALPVLAGRPIPMDRLIALAAALGSDVPFFLLGGKAIGIGRGTELYPLPDNGPRAALLVAPGIHVSTPDAYRALARESASALPANVINIFQSSVWGLDPGLAPAPGGNDFESVVFDRYPRLKSLKRQLLRLGATSAMLSGSGSALFGVFPDRAAAAHAARCFQKEKAFPVSFISRARYRSLWWRRLAPHIAQMTWPPRSRYSAK